VLGEIALSHAIQHRQHGLNGGEILSLNDLFKEFRIILGKILKVDDASPVKIAWK
jgi:hypothetical protein